PLASLGLEGCAGLALRSRSSSGARSKRRMMDCISSAVGASIKAKPLDSWVSWFRITLIESATRSSAVSHCLISSAVTQVGRLPKKTVKLIQFVAFTPWLEILVGSSTGGNPISCLPDTNRPIYAMQCYYAQMLLQSLGLNVRSVRHHLLF